MMWTSGGCGCDGRSLLFHSHLVVVAKKGVKKTSSHVGSNEAEQYVSYV